MKPGTNGDMKKDTFHLGIVQMAAGREPAANMRYIRRLTDKLERPCDLLVLPEYCLCLGERETLHRAARSQEQWVEQLAPLPAQLRVPVLFGGVPVRDGERVFNRALLMDADGRAQARYDKIHLFQLHTDDAAADETAIFSSGSRPVALDIQGWRIGLSICYDLRFPELYRAFVPADLLLCTAAFTSTTGKDHWHTLLRARAIENQCFMAGVAQAGVNPDSGTEYFGHSVVFDPWGATLAELDGFSDGLCTITLRYAGVSEARRRLPALRSRQIARGGGGLRQEA